MGAGNGITETALILAVDDAIAEDVETFTVSINSTDPPCAASPTASSQTATIIANDRKSEV